MPWEEATSCHRIPSLLAIYIFLKTLQRSFTVLDPVSWLVGPVAGPERPSGVAPRRWGCQFPKKTETDYFFINNVSLVVID